MIVLKNVTKIFPPNVVALDNISFEIKSGEFVLIIGRSGAGKSTVLRLINKEIDPTKGEIFYKNFKITKISSKEEKGIKKKDNYYFSGF
jgi:cell division transport system ATP-binding protein